MSYHFAMWSRILNAGLWVCVFSSCGHPVQRQLEGIWHGDSVENFESQDIARATGWAKGLRFSFDGPKLTVAIAAEQERTGEYRVRSVHNRDVVLAVLRPDGTEDVARLKLDDDGSVRWMLGESRAIVLRREL